MSRFDVMVAGGTVLDGAGSPPQRADVGISAGRIAAVERGLFDANRDVAEVIDARGRVVTPGFVDVHTHFDGQASWDDLLEPVSGHGVTTVIMGNCGVGFAPVRRGRESQLIDLMEGVEDIPGSALSEGIDWCWETFPDYLDALERKCWAVDVGTQVPHAPVRAYVLEDDAKADATPDDLKAMARVVREGIEAGAFGFTTSRTVGHRSVDGSQVPGTFAPIVELDALASAVAAADGRIFEAAPAGLFRSDDPSIVAGELDWMGRLSDRTGVTSTFILLQNNDQPDRWLQESAAAASWRQRGARVVPLVAARSAAVLYGWDVRHPFMARPTYRAIAHLPLQERLERLRVDSVRTAILAENDATRDQSVVDELRFLSRILPGCYVLSGVDPDYEQSFDQRLDAIAERTGGTVEAAAYDALLAETAMLRFPLYNYVTGDHSVLYEQLSDPENIVSLGDGGAHCAFICDASNPSYLLTHWIRDRTRGPKLQLPEVVHRLTSQPAELYGLKDRGRIEVGLKADLNVIDLEAMSLACPVAIHDLPAGGTRLIQPASGYDATIVSGVVTRRLGVDTGKRPGRLVRRS